MVRRFTNPTEIVLHFLPLVLEISKRDLDFVLSLSGRDKIFCFHKSPFPLTVHILARGNKDAIRNRRSDGVSPRYARPDEITDARICCSHAASRVCGAKCRIPDCSEAPYSDFLKLEIAPTLFRDRAKSTTEDRGMPYARYGTCFAR